MEISIVKWRLEPKSSADIRTITFLISTNLESINEKIVKISLSGSLMTQIGDYIDAIYESTEYAFQVGKLAAALLERELKFGSEHIYNPNLKFGYITDNFPFGALEIPKIDTL